MDLQIPIDTSYTNYFGLAEPPFDNTPNPAFFMDDGQYRAALAKLFKGVAARKGMMILHGDNGVGKTTLTMTLLRFLPEGTRLIHLTHPHSDSMELLNYVIDALGGKDPAFSFLSASDAIRDLLLEIDQQNGRVLMIIDEAQRLHDDTLEGVRLLSDLETEKYKLFQIILAGTQDLVGLLHRPKAKAFRQRISLFRELKPLPPERTEAYIKHRLRVAGAGREVFTPEAIELISRLAGGVPRMINHLADGGLTEAFLSEHAMVDRGDVQEAANDLGLFADGAFGTIHDQAEVEGTVDAPAPRPKFELIDRESIVDRDHPDQAAPEPDLIATPGPEDRPNDRPTDREAMEYRRYDRVERVSVEISTMEPEEQTPAHPEPSAPVPPVALFHPSPSSLPSAPPPPGLTPSAPPGSASDVRSSAPASPDSPPPGPAAHSVAHAPEWESPSVVQNPQSPPASDRPAAPEWESPSLAGDQSVVSEADDRAFSEQVVDAPHEGEDRQSEDENGDLDLLRLAESVDVSSFTSDHYLTMKEQLVLASGNLAAVEWKSRHKNITGEVIGFDKNRCVLMSIPDLSASQRKALVGEEVAVLIQADGRMYSFECQVESLITKPKPVFLLSYPVDVTIDDLRAAPRANCCIRTELTKGERIYSCLMVNVSQGGCRIAFRRRDEGGEIDLLSNDPVSLRFTLAGETEHRVDEAVVRNQASDDQMIVYGLSFERLNRETEQAIIDLAARGTGEICL